VGGDGCVPGDAGGATDAGGTTDAGGDGGSAAVDCRQVPALFPEFDRSCATETDCTIATRQINCCGTLMITGVRTTEVDAYQQAAATCASQYPLCGCANGPTVADDGTTAAGGLPARVQCLNDTCQTTFDSVAETTPCGTAAECDTASEVCVAREPVGPAIVYECRPLPGGCQDNRSCACTANALCDATFSACSDRGPNTISCMCLQCQ
jgi:hypothetical protein